MAQHQKSNHTKRPAKKQKSRRRGWAIFGTVFFSLLGVLMFTVSGVLWMFQYNRNDSLDALSDAQLGVNEELGDDIINIALFGIDSRNLNSFKGLSDSIMILSVDKMHNSIKITSVLRDSVVPIEGRGVNKINAAYSYGGPELAIKTLNENFGLNIRDYATVNFRGMADIIDAVGGIEVDLTEAERNNANHHITWLSITSGISKDLIKKAGPQTLNGNQSMGLVRYRYGYADADIGRVSVQRDFMMAALGQWASLKNIPKLPQALNLILDNSVTDLNTANLTWLAQSVLQCGTDDMQMLTIPHYLSGQYVIIDADDDYLNCINTYFNPYEKDITWEDLNIAY